MCQLGEVKCRNCGHTHEAVQDNLVRAGAQGGAGNRDLSAEVAAALSQVLNQGPAG
ncbi:hypothetical protein GCM10010182_83490 [Actinomadura cremea]|nr:hypothetical protein GCM10010182_83490 [Actinomadura cremea]